MLIVRQLFKLRLVLRVSLSAYVRLQAHTLTRMHACIVSPFLLPFSHMLVQCRARTAA